MARILTGFIEKALCRCVKEECGAQYVMISGKHLMLL